MQARYRVYRAEHGEEEQSDLRPPAEGEEGWLDVCGTPDDSVLQFLREAVGLHQAGESLIVSPPERSLTSVFGDHVVLVFRVLRGDPTRGNGVPLVCVLAKGLLVTVHPPLGEMMRRVQARMAEGGLRRGADFVLYPLLSATLEEAEGVVQRLVDRAEAINLEILRHPGRDLASDIFAVRRDALHLKRVLEPQREAFNLVGQEDFPYVHRENRAYFLELRDRMIQAIEDVEAVRESMGETVEAYSSVQSNRIDRIMKVLTIISVVFLPPTLIASIYGMNFSIPEVHWKYGYAYSLVLMAVVTGGLVAYLYRKGWLQ